MSERAGQTYHGRCVSENISCEFHASERTSLYLRLTNEECWGHSKTHMIWRRNLALVYGHDRPGQCHHFSVAVRKTDTHDSRPTPNPEINLPITILGTPPVKVWIAPPMVKTTAPLHRVPLRPIASPMCPAASEVTVEHQNGMRGLRCASDFFEGRTQCADF
jgi:hypothetical protein